MHGSIHCTAANPLNPPAEANNGLLYMSKGNFSLLLCSLELMQQHPDTRKLVLLGGTCMAVPQQSFQLQPGGCIVGTEGGTVLKCNMDANATAHQAFAQVNFAACWTCSVVHSSRIAHQSKHV